MSVVQTITTKAGKDNDSATMAIDFTAPETLAEAVELYGEEVVFSNALANIVIGVQGVIRRHMKGNEKTPAKDQAEIQAIISAYKPGVSTRTVKDPTEKILAGFQSQSPDKQKDIIAQLKAMIAEGKK